MSILVKTTAEAASKSINMGKKKIRASSSQLAFLPDTHAVISGLSHDLRSPLNSAIGFSEILLSERIGKLNAEQKKEVGIILRRSTELLKILDYLVEYCQVIQHDIEFHQGLIAVHTFLNSALDEILRSMDDKEKGINIFYTPPRISYRVLGDEQKLQLVLENIFEGVLSLFKPRKIHVNVKELPLEKSPGSRANLSIELIFSGSGMMETEELFTWGVESNIPGKVRFGMLLSRFYIAMMGGKMSVSRTKGRLEINLILCKEEL